MNLNIPFHPAVNTMLRQIRDWSHKPDTRDRLSGWGIALLVLLLLYGIAAISDVSTGAYATRVLAFTSVVNPAPATTVPASSDTRSTPERPRERAASLPAREAITLEQTLSRGGAGERQVVQRQEILSGAQRATLQRPTLSVDPARPAPRVLTNATNLSQRRVTIPGRPTLPSVEAPRLRKEVESGLSLPLQDRSAPEERQKIDVPDVRVFDETTLTADDERTAQIAEWVQRNPKTLPDVVMRHMDYMEGDFTTYVSVFIEGREMGIYLLVRGGYEQLQVVLVDGDRSFLFFDRGITRQASRFRVGSVSRSPEGISRIVSQEREITSAEAQDFYRIFLEWWESTESH